MLAGNLSPRDILLDVMRRHYRARRYDEAARVASLVAPYIHPRLTSASMTVRPSLADILAAASDEELCEFAEEADLADVRTKGTA
jgi:hypothetical protein